MAQRGIFTPYENSSDTYCENACPPREPAMLKVVASIIFVALICPAFAQTAPGSGPAAAPAAIGPTQPPSAANAKQPSQESPAQRPSETCQNGKPTGATEAQARSFEDLKQFNVSAGSNSTLVSTHIATAFLPAWIRKDTTRNGHFYNALGVDVSTAVPISSATLLAYAKQALLTTQGGVANLYFSAAGRDLCNSVFDWEPRRTAVDHAYVINSPVTGNELIAYVVDGVGIRAIKTALSGNGYGAVGTAYLGLGFDGPLFSLDGTQMTGRAVDDTTGLLAFQVYASENAVNPHTLETIFGTSNAPHTFATWGAGLRMGLPGRFFLNIDYSRGIGGYASSRLGDIALVSIGYNKPSQ